jgi:hypothetical protein
VRANGGDGDITAKVICRTCDNNWVSRIDNSAAQAMRPLIRGQHEVRLDYKGQTAVAAALV